MNAAKSKQEISELRRQMGATKRAESKSAKSIIIGMGFDDVRVTHSGHGWMEIEATTPAPVNCYCSEVPRNLGRCKSCTDVWHEGYVAIKHTVQASTGRTGDYDGYILVQLRLVTNN